MKIFSIAYLFLLVITCRVYPLSLPSKFVPFFIAHRVNDLESLNKFKEAGVDGVEFDLHITKDNILILIHDPSLFLNGEKRFTYELTYKEILQVYPETLRIEQFLECVGNLKLVVHIHNWFSNIEGYNKRIITKTLEAINKYNVYRIISFDIKQLELVKEYNKTVKTSYCTDYHDKKGIYAIDLGGYITEDDLVKRVTKFKIDQIVLAYESLRYAIKYDILTPIESLSNFILFLENNISAVAFDDINDFKYMKAIKNFA